MSSQEGDLYDASDSEDQVRPLSINKRQGYVQPGDGSSATSSKQSSMASANGDDDVPARSLSISERGGNVCPPSASSGGSGRPSSVHNEEEPDDAPTPRAGSPAPSVAGQVRGEMEPLSKRSVSDIRKTFEGVSNANDAAFPAWGFKIPRGQLFAAPLVDEDSAKPVANIRRSYQAFAHSETGTEDEYPNEGSRKPRQPHFQGSLRGALDKLEQIPSRRFLVTGSRCSSRTPSIHEEAEACEERRDPASPRPSYPPTIHQETYDALHGRGPATVSPEESSQPSPDDATEPRRESVVSSRYPLRAPSVNKEVILEHNNERSRTPQAASMLDFSLPRGEARGPGRDAVLSSRRSSRASFLDNIEEEVEAEYARRAQRKAEEQASRSTSVTSSCRASRAPSVDNIEKEIRAHCARRAVCREKQPAKEQGPYRGLVARSRPTSGALDNIEEEIEAEYARRKQREAEEQQPRRERVCSPPRSSRAPAVDNLEEEIEAGHARRKAAEEQSRGSSVDNSRRFPRVPVDNIEEQIKAEYARRAQKVTQEQQSRRSSVASWTRSSRTPAMSIEEVEALYARGDVSSQGQALEPDYDGTVTPQALSPSRRASPRVPEASSPRLPTSPRYAYEENQFPAYTPSRHSSVRVRRDFHVSNSTCRYSLDESNIHPAFRAEPYFSPSSPRRESRTESLDHHESKTRPSSSTNERRCSTIESLCDECRHILKAIQPDVSDKYLKCPPDIHPVLVECILTGTSDEAAVIAGDLHERIIRYTSRQFDLHAAVRRSATSGRRPGHWYDITTKELPCRRACSTSRHYDKKSPGTIQKVFYSPYSWAKKQEKKKQKHIKDTHVKLRDMKILIDFPWEIEKGGMIERKIFESLPNNAKVTKLKHIRVHHTLHRLEWWARTHPVHHYATDASWGRGKCSRPREHGAHGQHSCQPCESSSREREHSSQYTRRLTEPAPRERDYDRDRGRKNSHLHSCRASHASFI